MPLDADLVTKVHSGTTVRAGIAAKAALLVAPEKAERYLRALREASRLDAKDMEKDGRARRIERCGGFFWEAR